LHNKKIKVNLLHNSAAERAVLSGVCSHGASAFVDISGIIEFDTFVIEENQIIYKCLCKVLEKSDSVDVSSILAAANDLNFQENLSSKNGLEHLRAVYHFPIKLENVRPHAVKIRKLQLARDIQKISKEIYDDISTVDGDESISEIINIAEKPILDFSSNLNREEDSTPSPLGQDIEEYIKHLEENPSDILGIPSGYSRYDMSIGGGFRRKCVDLIAARPKVGKSMFGDNVAMHVAGELNIPVLMLDTEMSKEDHLNRILAKLSGIDINDISTGKCFSSQTNKEKIERSASKIEEIPYDYISISGKPFDEILSLMRRWIIQTVGFDENGRTNNCLIIYDYLKLMTSDAINNSVQEFQALGFQITSLHNFCVEYDCPCLSFVQLNRDGITKESTDVVSGSDRLIWLCTSFSIFKNKSDEEIAEDGDEHGNKKLVPIVARHGPGLSDRDYISMAMKGETANIVEKCTRNEIRKVVKQKDEGFVVEDNNKDDIPFEM